MTAPAPHRSWRRRLGEAVLLLVTSAATLWLTLALVPGVAVSGGWDAVVATLVIALASAVVRPLLATVATLIGWVGVVLAGLAAQGLIFYVALSVAPDVSLSGFWPAFWAAWLYALLVGVVGWLLDAGDDDLFVADVIRGASRSGPTVRATEPGVVIIQIDGLSAPLFHWGLQAGDLPTLARWIRSGSHRPVGWRAQLPPTTPASQAGILHGRSDAVPAFRWYDKEAARLTVTNHPADAAYVERSMSDGRGLLADGGVSIGNIFSGDAAKALLTISADPGRAGPSRRFAAAYLRPFGFTRAFVLSIGEMVKELHQGHRQRVRRVEPRIDRRSSYVVLRAMTNVVLRDVNVRLLAEEMLHGTPVMYCDFTDYDEVAHHAGPMRAESIASLAGVDRALGALERIAAAASRPYEFVVLSDHGQSQGATFRQRCGESLEQVVRRYADDAVRSVGTAGATSTATAGTDEGSATDEAWGPVGVFLAAVGGGRGPAARLGRRVGGRHGGAAREATPASAADIVVAASGNLGFVYFTDLVGRASFDDVETSYPGLVARLAQHDGVGFVVTRSVRHGVVATGRDGSHFLDEARVEGTDPLAPFGPDAAAEVHRHALLANVGDLMVNSCVDELTGEVAAFEELVGCHGGLGGWQSEAVLVHPTRWDPPDRLVGADAVHHQLVRWLADLGLRAEPATAPSPVAGAGVLATP
jgi:uncharacterized membrane protein YvlD (DUF360 family)